MSPASPQLGQLTQPTTITGFITYEDIIYIDVDYSSSGNIMLSKLNQLLEINFYNSHGYVASGNYRLHQASDWSHDKRREDV